MIRCGRPTHRLRTKRGHCPPSRPLVFEPLEERLTLSGTVIDHNDLAVLQALPQAALAAVAEQRWFFSHASVGGNMRDGMTDLYALDSTRYPLVVSDVSYNSSALRAYNPPASTAPGTIYACNRSNPGWQNKLTIFQNSLNVSGWHDASVDVVMDKFCYIDQAASATTYLESMSTLEAAYPTTRFVYMTMPLTTSADSNNVLRNTYNDAVRAYCTANSRLLFDLADIECYDPSGNATTFVNGGTTYQRLYSGYTTDGGHLNDAANVGRQHAALGWYATAALIAGTLGTPTDVSLSGTTIAENQAAGAAVGTLATTDRDTADTFTYSLVSGDGSDDNGLFTVVGSQLQTLQPLDFETQSECHVRVRVTDRQGLECERTFTITVGNTNDAPTLDASGNLVLSAIDEDDTASGGTLVSQLLASAGGTPIADADAGALAGIAITAADSAHGTWQYALSAGAWTALATPSEEAAVLLPADADASIRFLPAADFNGSLDAAITFVAWDQTSGAAGATADTSPRGGTTAFSTAVESASITINAVADPPAVVAPLADVTVAEGAASTVIELASVFADPDAGDVFTYLVAPTTVEGLAGAVSQSNYTHLLQDLLYTHLGDNRGYGAQHDLARDNIKDYFQSLGLTTTLEAFTYSSATYYNVVATKLGATRPNDVYVVGAHYDSVNNPGADDNASGTAAVMEIARVLASCQFDATLRFVAFDREEQGLKGSYAYVAAHSSDNILGMVNLDMIAYNPAGITHNTVALFDRYSGGSMKSNLAAAVASYSTGITTVDRGQIWGSDHSPFEEAGFDAALMIEYSHASNPNYHKATDAVETANYLDYAFATEIARAATGYLASAAGLLSTSDLLATQITGTTLTLDYVVGQSGGVDVTVRATDLLGGWAEDTFHVTVTAGSRDLDADGNGTADALTDGILVLRYLFDPEGEWNCNDALGSGATRTTRAAIRSYLDGAATVLDVDGNGTADALTDGILALRYLFDPAGQWNFNDALGSGATRTDRDTIRDFLDQYNPGVISASVLKVEVPSVAAFQATSPQATTDTSAVSSEVATPSPDVATDGILPAPATDSSQVGIDRVVWIPAGAATDLVIAEIVARDATTVVAPVASVDRPRPDQVGPLPVAALPTATANRSDQDPSEAGYSSRLARDAWFESLDRPLAGLIVG